MGEAIPHGAHERGGMDVREHRETFHGFMAVTVWSCALIAMAVAGLTVAFATGGGWFGGVAVWALIGAVAGAVLKMSARWWGALIVSTGLFVVGGAIAALIAGLA